MGVEALANVLTEHEKALFLATNLPYFAVALLFLAQFGSICPTLCSCSSLHTGWITVIGVVSTIFHGTQVQCSCCAQRRKDGEPAADVLGNIVKWVVADVGCAVSYAVFLGACRGLAAALQCSWPLLLLVGSVFMRARGSPRGYAIVHGLWHLASAAVIAWSAIALIVSSAPSL